MAERDGYAHGVPSWIDLGTTDVAGATRFYGELFGWEAGDMPTDQGMPSTVFTKHGKVVAGCGPIPPDMPQIPFWNSYVNVDHVDETLARVEAAGGTVIMPAMEVMTQGRTAFVADPTGAAFGLWQPGDHQGAQLVDEDGSLTWNELMTDDVGTAAAFYASTLGWEAETQEMPGGFSYTTFRVGDAVAAGMMEKQPQMQQVPNNWGVYFAVDDCDGCAARITELGGTVMQPPFDTPIGRMAVASDPQGAPFMVISSTVPRR